MAREEVLTAEALTSDEPEEPGLRPRRLDEFVGQAELKDHLDIILEAARRRGQAADHLLFAGPPGLGKTTLAGIVAAEMDVRLHVTSGPALERGGDLASILSQLEPGDVLFIDEIHRLSRAVEEVLYPAMEDFQLDIVLGKGPAARSIRLDVPQLHAGRRHHPHRADHRPAARPLRARRPPRLLRRRRPRRRSSTRAAGILEVAHRRRRAPSRSPAGPGAPRASPTGCCAGSATTPRSGATAWSTGDAARAGLALFGVDELGLDKVDRAILDALCERFGGGPVGLSTLAISVAEPTETVEDVYEPFLIQQGLLMRTPRGRVPTPAAWAHLGIPEPQASRRDDPLFD